MIKADIACSRANPDVTPLISEQNHGVGATDARAALDSVARSRGGAQR